MVSWAGFGQTCFWLILSSTAGHVAFFSFISHFKNPKDFPKALFLLQIPDISMYIVVAVVVYRFAGNKVSSPALGSAEKIVSKVAYGVAIPTVWPCRLL
jgi:amino acid permease